MLTWLANLIRQEPARIKALIAAVLVLVATFVPKLTAEQREAVMGVVSLLIVLMGEGVRSMVTPNAKLSPETQP